MKCFYHHDMDGKCAGAIVKHMFPECEMFHIDYKDRFPIEIIQLDEIIYIVDFSIFPNEMRILLQITKNVHWIDHHKTSIERYKDFEHDIQGLRVLDIPSGCECTWKYIHPNKEIPFGVQLIGDRDTWTWKYKNQTKYFWCPNNKNQ